MVAVDWHRVACVAYFVRSNHRLFAKNS